VDYGVGVEDEKKKRLTSDTEVVVSTLEFLCDKILMPSAFMSLADPRDHFAVTSYTNSMSGRDRWSLLFQIETSSNWKIVPCDIFTR
jgi:hypothetical protein